MVLLRSVIKCKYSPRLLILSIHFEEIQKIYSGRRVNSIMALVKIRDGESFESAFRKFKKSCEKAGILSEVKKREHFEKPSVSAKKKSIAARKRATKKTRGGFRDRD